MLQRQTAARPHLAFVSFRDGHGNAGGNKFLTPCVDRDLPFHRSVEVNAGGMLRLIVRNRKPIGIFELVYLYNKMIRHNSIRSQEPESRSQNRNRFFLDPGS
jgi:hypothetical protein